jgi:hypothetical protein
MTARGFFGYSREEKEVMAEHEQNQVDPPETDEEKLISIVDQLEAVLVPTGTCWPGFDYAGARKKAKTILRYEIALARAGK